MKKSLLFVIPLAVLLTILLISAYLLLTPNSQEVYALETEEIEPLEETATLFIDGEQDTSLVTIELGESKTFSVLYRGDYYVPTISDENGLMAVSYSNGTVTVEENCQLGELLLTLSCTFNDGTSFYDNILINVVGQSSSYVQLNQTGDGLFVDLADNVKYVDAYTTTELDDPKTVRLYDGDNLDLVLADNKHNSSGVTLNYTTAGLISDDGNGNETVQEMQNGSFGVSMASETTHSLLGSGTSSNPYRISDETDFHAIGNYDSQDTTVYFAQTANFTMSTTFTQFHFYGNYNGKYQNQQYAINIISLTNSYSAMFRQNYGTIQNVRLYVKSLSITKLGAIGIICTQNHSLITNVRVDLHPDISGIIISSPPNITFNAAAFKGGITGTNFNGGEISNCMTTMIIDASCFFGGIANINDGIIRDCVSYSTLKDIPLLNLTRIGGLVGSNTGHIYFSSNTSFSINLTGNFVVDDSGDAPCVGGIIGYNTTPASSLGFDPDNIPRVHVNYYITNITNPDIDTTYCNEIIGQDASN